MENHWIIGLSKNKFGKIILSILVAILFVTVMFGLFTDRHINLFGVEFNSEIKQPIVKYVPAKKESKNQVKVNNNLQDTTPPKNDYHKSDSYVKSNASKYNVQNVTATNLQIGDHNVQNIGVQPRKVTEDSIRDFLNHFPDKSMHIGFIAPNSDKETINAKNQIIDILESKGYNNIEKDQGIRIMLDGRLPDNRIIWITNKLGGMSFYIP